MISNLTEYSGFQFTPNLPIKPANGLITWREVEREIEQADQDGEGDRTDAWEAYIRGTHPIDLDNLAMAQMVRDFWIREQPRDIEDYTSEEIETLDREIRRIISNESVVE